MQQTLLAAFKQPKNVFHIFDGQPGLSGDRGVATVSS